jgi:hypothetical protein
MTQGGGWYYKRNMSANNQVRRDKIVDTIASFGPLEEISSKPSIPPAEGHAYFTDVRGDGVLDLVWMDKSTWGFFSRHSSPSSGWSPFRKFGAVPNIPKDQTLRFIDLTGDGLPDILISEDDAFVWYPALGQDGYGGGSRTAQSLGEEQGPRLLFGDTEETIHFADMSGDGLTDLLRVRNGEVCYWPNTGYGNFGAKITMSDAPWFDETGAFDGRRIHICDIDGSGTNDIL